MQIKLRQTEIEEALQQYIVSQGINLTGKKVKIDFTASRSSDGLTADVDISNDNGLTSGEVAPRAEHVHQAEEIPAPESKEEAKDDESGEQAQEPAAQAASGNSLFS